MGTIPEFYADEHIALPFGVIDGLHTFHSGQDVNGWREGTPIPSIAKGRVVMRGSDPSDLGNFITIRAYDGNTNNLRPERMTYCHLKEFDASAPKVGDVVAKGGYVGPLGTTGYSTGPHLHLMVSLTSDDPRTRAGIIDPLPYILAARSASTAGGDIEPFPTAPGRKVSEMPYIIHKVTASPNRYYRTGEFSCFQVSEATRNALVAGGAPEVEVSSSALTTISASAALAAQKFPQLANLPTASVSDLFTESDRAALLDLPTKGELGQALTSTVALVNEHADENKDAIIAAIPSGSGGSASIYSLNLNIDQVPGTATGTATPA